MTHVSLTHGWLPVVIQAVAAVVVGVVAWRTTSRYWLRWVARLTPSGALTESLTQAMSLSVDWFGIAVLAAWGVIAGLAAMRWFRFS